jgi:two-component system cell cycle response regulator DivK
MARILIVEDNAANMRLVVLLLEKVGHIVLCAENAETGLARARVDHPDLILMDIQLPGINGLTATALLKKDPATAAIPIIALTAMAQVGDQDKSKAAGCDGYLSKPLSMKGLYSAIDSLLDKGVGPQVATVETQP